MDLAICAVCLLIPLADPANLGPYSVGSTTITIEDKHRDRQLITEIWYPTLYRDGLPAPAYSSGAPTIARREAPPAEGRFPVVLFSHGLAAVREQATFLTEHLASHGYVVISPDHQNNTGRDLKPLKIVRSARERPVDLRLVLNRILQLSANRTHWLYGLLAEERIAALGHSLGGYTALAVAGAWVSATPFEGKKRVEYFDYSDPRIRAVIAYMPVYEPYFDGFGLRRLSKPALIVSGTEDVVTRYERNQLPLFNHLQTDSTIALIDGATHFSLLNEEVLDRAAFFIKAMHRPKIDRDKADATVRRLTLAFLEKHLRQDDRFAQWLNQNSQGVELTHHPVSPLCCGVENE